MKLSIIIPCYNEDQTIAEVIAKILKVDLGDTLKEIIIVDDGSTDNTRKILANYQQPEIKIIYHQNNQGKTAAIKTALTAATGDYTIIQDADLEYEPQDIKKLLDTALTENLPVVYGSRRLNKKNNYFYLSYYLGANFLTLLSNFFFRQKITDVATCYKLIKTDLLKKFDINSKNFIFCNEVTGKIANLGIIIKEVPISYNPRSLKEGKKLKLRHGLEAIIATIKYRYKSKAQQFNCLDLWLQQQRFGRIIKLLKPNTKLLDLGCGLKYKLASQLQGLNIEYYGLDIKIDYCPNQALKLQQTNFDNNQSLPYDSNYFDFIISLANLEHLQYYQNNLQEIHRLLKPGGNLLLTTPTPRAKPILELLAFLHLISGQEIKDHKQYFSKDKLMMDLTAAGFSQNKISHHYFQLGCNQFIQAQK